MWGYLYCYISNSISKKRKTFKPLQLTFAGRSERLVGLCALNKSHFKSGLDLLSARNAQNNLHIQITLNACWAASQSCDQKVTQRLLSCGVI